MDISQCRTAQTDRCRYIIQLTLHQHNIGRIDCDIRSGSDCNSHICPCQGRCIVDAVTYHGNLSFFFQRADDTFLSFRKDSGNDLINACLPSDRPCCPLIVPGQHDYPDSHVLQFFYGSCTLFFDHIRYCDHTEQTVFFCKKQRRLSIFCQCFHLAFLFL